MSDWMSLIYGLYATYLWNETGWWLCLCLPQFFTGNTGLVSLLTESQMTNCNGVQSRALCRLCVTLSLTDHCLLRHFLGLMLRAATCGRGQSHFRNSKLKKSLKSNYTSLPESKATPSVLHHSKGDSCRIEILESSLLKYSELQIPLLLEHKIISLKEAVFSLLSYSTATYRPRKEVTCIEDPV